MAISPILLIALFSLIYGNYVIPIEATHHVYRTLESSSSYSSHHDQPYRTAYHFQPLKNWINGIFLHFTYTLYLYTFFLTPCAKYFNYLSLTNFYFACFCPLTCYAEMYMQTPMVSLILFS